MSRVLKPSARWQINGHYANSVDATKPVSLNSGTEKYAFVDGKLCFNFDGSTDLSHAAADTDTIAYMLDGHRYACVAGTTYYKDAAPVAPYTFYADATSIGTGLTGKMRDVTHWPVELTADELAQDFAMSLTPDHYWEPALPIPQSAPMYDSLAAYLFDDGLNPLLDVSGGGNNLTKTLAPTFTEIGAQKSAESGYTSAGSPSILNLTATMAVAGWVKVTDLSKIRSVFTRWGASRCYSLHIKTDGTAELAVSPNGSSPYTYAAGPSTIKLNRWHHVAFVYTGAYLIVYVDGEPGTPVAYSSGINQTAAVGHYIGGPNPYFTMHGEIDGVIYRATLSSAQIKKIYRSGVPADRDGELLRTLDGKTDLSAYGRTITRSNCVSLPDRMTFANGGLSWSAIAGIQSYGYTYIDPTTGIPSHYATDGVTTWTNGIATGAMPFAVGSTGFSAVTADLVDLWATSGSITAEQVKRKYARTKVIL